MEERRHHRVIRLAALRGGLFFALAWWLLAGCEYKSNTGWQTGAPPRDYPMHVAMIVSGGFAGIAGRWVADANSFNNSADGSSKFDELARLVQQARAQGTLGKDFSQSASGTMSQPVPDAQTYDIEVDGEHVRWSEPAPAGAAAAPPVVQSLKTWLMNNTERQPYRYR